MITLLIVSDGYKHFGIPIEEYEKRIQKFANIRKIKPISHTNSEYIKVKETFLIIEKLKKMKGKIILLDERGHGQSSVVFSAMLENQKNKSEDTIFIIGGSYGVDREIFRDIPHSVLSLSDFVMPHGLALLVLLEQIYRAHEIMKGSGYHHT